MNLDGSISVIIEFKRGKVLCTNNVIICPSEDDFSIDVYHVERNKAWYAITPDHKIFIQHNPHLTCAICNELHDVAVKRHKANEQRLAAVTAMVNYNPGVSVRKYIPPRFEVPSIPDGQVFKYLCLESLADNTLPSLVWEDTSEDFEPDKKGRIKCFLCSERIHWKFTFSITSNRVATVLQDGNLTHKTASNNLYKHCEVKKHALFHFIATEVFDEKGQTTFLQIQKSMKKGIFCFNDNIPLMYFQYMAKGKPHLLLQAINQVMGAAMAFNKQTMLSGLKLIKGFHKEDFRKEQFRSYINYCDKQLRLIAFCLGSFDYISLLQQGVTSNVLWNSMNLFFKQGMYFTMEFTPISMLHIENIVLDKKIPITYRPHRF